MKRILMAGFALALVAGPALAQGTGNSGASQGANRGAEQSTQVPNTQSTNGADTMKPNPMAGPSATSAGMNEAQAKAKLEASGYTGVTGLMVGPDGLWHGRAMKGGAVANVGLDGQGNVIAR